MSESTIKKCFAKAGILSADKSLVAFPADHWEFDPFEDLDSGGLVQVNSLLRDTNPVSESDTPYAVEALEATSTLPTCKEHGRRNFSPLYQHPPPRIQTRMTATIT